VKSENDFVLADCWPY